VGAFLIYDISIYLNYLRNKINCKVSNQTILLMIAADWILTFLSAFAHTNTLPSTYTHTKHIAYVNLFEIVLIVQSMSSLHGNVN